MRKQASLETQLDAFIRISILEGVAGVPQGTWTRAGSGGDIRSGLRKAQEELPLLGDAWFKESDTTYRTLVSLLRKQAKKYGQDMGPDILADLIFSKELKNKFHRLGETRADYVLDHPESPARLYGSFRSMTFNQASKAMRTVMQYERADQLAQPEYDFESEMFNSGSPLGRAFYEFVMDEIPSLGLKAKNFDAEAAFTDYFEALWSGRKGPLSLVADQYGISPSNLHYLVKKAMAMIEERASNDRGLLQKLERSMLRDDFLAETPQKFDFSEYISKTASAISKELMRFTGGRPTLERVFDAHTFNESTKGFSFFIPERRTPWGQTNWIYVKESLGDIIISLWLIRAGKQERVKELRVSDVQDLPDMLGNALMQRYRNPRNAANADEGDDEFFTEMMHSAKRKSRPKKKKKPPIRRSPKKKPSDSSSEEGEDSQTSEKSKPKRDDPAPEVQDVEGDDSSDSSESSPQEGTEDQRGDGDSDTQQDKEKAKGKSKKDLEKAKEKAEKAWAKYREEEVLKVIKEKYAEYKEKHPGTELSMEEFNKNILKLTPESKITMDKTYQDFLDDALEDLDDNDEMNVVEGTKPEDISLIDRALGL